MVERCTPFFVNRLYATSNHVTGANMHYMRVALGRLRLRTVRSLQKQLAEIQASLLLS